MKSTLLAIVLFASTASVACAEYVLVYKGAIILGMFDSDYECTRAKIEVGFSDAMKMGHLECEKI